MKIRAPKVWAYWHPGDEKYITDPEIRDGTEKVLQVRFITETDYRTLLRLAKHGEKFLELERQLGSSSSGGDEHG